MVIFCAAWWLFIWIRYKAIETEKLTDRNMRGDFNVLSSDGWYG